MQTINELLSRIRWDREFGCSSFEIGYYDRVKESIIRIPFDEIIQQPGNSFSFQIIDRDGMGRTIPLHRVREVFRDGVLIWQRQP